MRDLYLIDASIYIFRAYFSLPENWHSREGYPTQAVYGYLNFLLNLLEQESPDYIAAAFDESLGSCFRNQIYPAYKSSRVLPDEPLAFQLNACAEVTRLLGLSALASDTHEADDIVGTLAKMGREQNHRIVVVSGDKDLSQLIEGTDVFWDFGKKDPMGRAEIKNKIGVWPEQQADYLALVGDKVDDIPGVPGIGAKTAVALLNHFDDLEALLAAGEQLATIPVRGAKSLPAKLASHREQLQLVRQLTTISDAAPVGKPSLRRTPVDMDQLVDFCERMGLGGRPIARAKALVEESIVEALMLVDG